MFKVLPSHDTPEDGTQRPKHAGMSYSTRMSIRAAHAGMAAIRPLVRLLGRERLERPLAWIERQLKGALFDCRMCGQCTLNVTALKCPMRCLKGMRNGPCGGVRSGGFCEIDAAFPCAWRDIWLANGGLLPERQAPLDHRLNGRSTWIAEAMDDSPPLEPLPPRREVPVGRLEKELARGNFVVTAEIAPGTAASGSALLAQAKTIAPWVQAMNVTDGAGGNAALSSLAAAALLVRAGYPAVVQLTCRDRNRIALQNDLLGAAALGIENILCLTGDGVGNGDHPGAKPVFDLDAISLLATARTMRDGAKFLSGRDLAGAPDYFIGAVANPFSPPEPARLQRLKMKIDAGAQFVQTQYVFDVPAFAAFMAEVCKLGLHRRCYILAGVGFMASAKTARWMTNKLPGVRIPEHLIHRLEQTSEPLREGVSLSVDLVRELRDIEGVAGVHLMFHHQRLHLLPEVVEGALR